MGKRKLFSFRSRDKPQNSINGNQYTFYYGSTTSGKPVTERTAMQITAVNACVRVLSEALASLPLHMYRYTENGGKEKATEIFCGAQEHRQSDGLARIVGKAGASFFFGGQKPSLLCGWEVILTQSG